jgi:multidrug efflux pump subunit AcrB
VILRSLEQQINGVAGMIYMSSVSANDGSSAITVSFDVVRQSISEICRAR